ncbi:MAG: hypothetical protein Q9213_006481 [Squamulea squamosa]
MSLSFAKAGASSIAVGARGDMASLVEDIKNTATAAERSSPKVLPIILDVTSQESIDGAAALVEKEFGKIDIVINNAGVVSAASNIADSDTEDWWRAWTVNVRGTYLVTRALLPLMLKGGVKQIINVCSAGAHVIRPGLSAYQSSKLAQLRFTEFVCAEYGDQGVVAFCIHPGNIPTDIVGGPEGVPEDLRHGTCVCFVSSTARGAANRLSVFVETPELSADTIVYLVNEKREWLAGRYINCTWDMPQLMAMETDIVKGDKLKVRMVV